MLPCLPSQELIPFIYHINAKSKENVVLVVAIWSFTEDQTGRERLDTHFSIINLILKSYVEVGNDVVLEEYTLAAISFCGGAAVTTGMLLDCDNVGGQALSKMFKKE